MKLIDMVLIGGLAYLALTRTAGASNQPSTPPLVDSGQPINLEVISSPAMPAAKFSDIQQFMKHISDQIALAGFSRPSFSVPFDKQYDNKLISQAMMPVFDARVALTNRMKAYWGSGNPSPPEMQTALAAVSQLEGNLRREMRSYFSTGAWS